MKRKEKNTPNIGAVRTILFKHTKENQWYGVALEFNLVVSGDTFEETQYELSEAIMGYVETLRMIKGLKDFTPLNQKADTQYEELWEKLRKNKSIPSPFQVSHFGIQNIHA